MYNTTDISLVDDDVLKSLTPEDFPEMDTFDYDKTLIIDKLLKYVGVDNETIDSKDDNQWYAFIHTYKLIITSLHGIDKKSIILSIYHRNDITHDEYDIVPPDEELNKLSLYLHYDDEETVVQVINTLKAAYIINLIENGVHWLTFYYILNHIKKVILIHLLIELSCVLLGKY